MVDYKLISRFQKYNLKFTSRATVRQLFQISTLFFLCLSTQVQANSIEVLHWWTSGSEAKSIQILQQDMQAQNFNFHNFPVEGLAGESAFNTLRTRALSGDPPQAAQIKGEEIQRWAKSGLLTSLDQIATSEQWYQRIPSVIAELFKFEDQFVAVPFNIHRVNWLWVNPAIFKQLNLNYPISLDEMLAVAQQIKNAGFIPFAIGNEPWQLATLFESIALATMGPDTYRAIFMEQDPNALNSDTLQKALEIFRKIKQYSDPNAKGRSWHDTAKLLLNDQAAMQFMGDWVKGEFIAANKKVAVDYQCIPAPGTQGSFSFNIDSFVFFKHSDPKIKDIQLKIASNIMTSEFQQKFNRIKGSIPITHSSNLSQFDLCAQISMIAFEQAKKNNQFVASFSHDMALNRASQIAIFDVLSKFYNAESPCIQETIRHLRAAILANKL